MSKKTSNKKKHNNKNRNTSHSAKQKQTINKAQSTNKKQYATKNKSTNQKKSVKSAQSNKQNKAVHSTQSNKQNISANRKSVQTNNVNKFYKSAGNDSIGLTAFTAVISIICVVVIAVFLVNAITSANITVDETSSSDNVSSSSMTLEQDDTNTTETETKTVLHFNRDSVIYTAELKLEDDVSNRHTEFLTNGGKVSSSSNQSSENTQTDTSSSSEQEASSSSKPSSSYSTSVSVSTTNFQSNLSQYKAINSDTVAWINVPGTNINYPVVKYATDNNYYIDKNVYKNYSRNGVIWADFRNSFPTLSKNTIFYGHNWTNISYSPRIGSSSDVMFAQLTSLQYTSQVAKYPYINVSVEGRDMKFVIFANFYTNISFYYIDPNPSSLMTLVDGARKRSESIINVDVNESDKILTLSTCTRAFGKSDQQRFVVMARLLRDGESLSSISVSKNPNPLRPF